MVFIRQIIPGKLPARSRAPRAWTVGSPGRSRWWRLYLTARWNNPKHGLRIRALTRDLFTCQRCGLVDHSSRLHAHHRVPHHGDPHLFWDINNVTTLCEDCHRTEAAQVEARGYHDALDNDGYPIDPNHPANQKGALIKRPKSARSPNRTR